MSTPFRQGWYEIAFDAKTYRTRCRYFRNRSFYTAECVVDSNGRQYLLWQDVQGPTGAGRPGEWSSTFKPLPNADDGDWWDNPANRTSLRPAVPSAELRNFRKPTAREMCARASKADDANLQPMSCTKEIHVGIFFDGTNNNKERDRRDFGHSNVVSLFDIHKTDETDHFAYYLPGVGTKFEQVKEMGEDAGGKTFSSGGERRIHFAMLNVYNAVCRAATGKDLIPGDEMTEIVTATFSDLALSTWWRLSDNRMNYVFERLDARLMKALEGRRPRITKLHLSVFGFSRGAAQARVFCKWIQRASQGQVGTAVLQMRFLGIFDTVASVGLAASGPVFSGFFDWANGNLDIAGIDQTAHFVAAHELRYSFPLSTARVGKVYGSRIKEYVYPGCHSDIGGGYSPGDQGKAIHGRSSLLSQLPLNDMLREALNAGVQLKRLEEATPVIKADFKIAPALDEAFSAYLKWTEYDEKEDVASARIGTAEDRMHYHTRLYWRWRAKVSDAAAFSSLSSYTSAKSQERTDLAESQMDWLADVANARVAIKPTRVFVARVGYVERPPIASGEQRDLLREISLSSTVPAAVDTFFDQYVHDSHAGFYLLGVQTELDKQVFIQSIKDKKRVHDAAVAEASRAQTADAAFGLWVLAKRTELNRFEERVLATDQKTPNQLPPMSDADAADLRDNAGLITGQLVIRRLLGTATRREPHGHGHYRTVFDHS